jgi:hypothetical protein
MKTGQMRLIALRICWLAGAIASIQAQQTSTSESARVAIDADDIGGVVSGPHGPEADGRGATSFVAHFQIRPDRERREWPISCLY